MTRTAATCRDCKAAPATVFSASSPPVRCQRCHNASITRQREQSIAAGLHTELEDREPDVVPILARTPADWARIIGERRPKPLILLAA